MRKAIVGTCFGYSTIGYGYDERFPNAKHKKGMGCILSRWPTHRLALIQHCRICDSIEKMLNRH